MRISDWSSDVCSSDLRLRLGGGLYDDPAANGARCEADVPLPAALYYRHARDPRLSLSFRQPSDSDTHAVLPMARAPASRVFRLCPLAYRHQPPLFCTHPTPANTISDKRLFLLC